MKSVNVLLVLSIMLAAASIIFAGFNILSYGMLNNLGATGFLTSNQTSGLVNVTVQSNLIINFTTDAIWWGSGRVDPGANNATLDTSRNTTYKVLNGNWNTFAYNKSNGFIIENIGNLNASLWIATAKNSTQFLGGGNPAYQFNITNNEANSCTNATGLNLGGYYDVNTTGLGTNVCSLIEPNDARDTVRLDILLRIPSGSLTGELTDTITATASAA